MENQKIIVLGSTGYIGSATVKTLASQKHNVTAGVRDISKATELEAAGAKVIKADMGQTQSELAAILSNFNSVYLVTPGNIDRANITINAIKAAKEAKVNYVLLVSVPVADNLNVVFGRQFNAIEKELKSSGLNYGILRLPMFTDNIWGNAGAIKTSNTFYGPVDGSVKFTTVAISDAALAATTILTNPSKHTNKTYTLTSDLKSADEQAEAYSKALGREIKYVNGTYEGTKKALLAFMPEWQVDGVLELYQLAEKKDVSQTVLTTDITTITGQQATSHLTWMTTFASAF